MDGLTDDEALAAVRRIRAISWRWRWREAIHAMRILWGFGRRHYGVAAQDVERELGARVPGIIGCTRERRCPRHHVSTVDTRFECIGRLTVDYRILADVVEQALGCLRRRPGPADLLPTGPGRGRLSRRCYQQIAAIQIYCAAADSPGSAGR